eukprot:GSChrysophyteH1.ASY1.ANO1.1199.1 assembled CDS
MSGFDDDDDRSYTSEVSGVSALTNTMSHLGGGEDAQSEYGGDYDGYEDGYAGEDGEECEHACAYCGIRDPSCVAKCVETGKWFCNGRGVTRSSHIIQHLVYAKKNIVSLHADGLLGVVFASKQRAMALICRDSCLRDKSGLKELEWDPEEWKPVIKEKALDDWVCSVPDIKVQVRAAARAPLQLTISEITQIEKVWRDNPDATISEALEGNRGDEDDEHWLENHMMGERFEDGYSYQNKLAPLVLMESEEDRKLKENQKYENVDVQWEKQGKRYRATFTLPLVDVDDGGNNQVMVGDELKLAIGSISYEQNYKRHWESNGRVISVEGAEICLELFVPDHITDFFIVECLWKSTSYDRMQQALKTFAVDDTCISGTLYHMLMGHEHVPYTELNLDVPDNLVVKSMVPNESQEHAIRSALKSPLSLIQGPPGTGKTFTAASIVYHMSRQSQGQILVCAPSNVAVDHLTDKIDQTGLKVVRLSAKTREASDEQTPEHLKHLFLHNMDEMGGLNPQDQRMYAKLYEAAEKEILSSADVICSTCIGAGDPRIAKFRFRQVLIDESTQAMEAECIIPLVRGVKQLVLIGDHQQLGPVVMCTKAAKAGLTRSLFERMMSLSHRPILLNIQYRMHPALSEWPSSRIHEAASELEWLDHSSGPLHFQIVRGSEEIATNGTSFLNRKEAEHVEKLVSALFKSNVLPSEIGVITPYEAQRSYTTTYLKNNGSNTTPGIYDHVEIASVDAFQGREKDFIILSCVRSNETQGIGFLKDARRLNVALTRARYGVFIIGDASVLCKNHLWNNLLHHYQSKGALVEGPLKDLRQSTFQVPFLRDSRDRQNNGGRGGPSQQFHRGESSSEAPGEYDKNRLKHSMRIGEKDGRYDRRYDDVKSYDGSFYSQAQSLKSSNAYGADDGDSYSVSTMQSESTLGAISQASVHGNIGSHRAKY